MFCGHLQICDLYCVGKPRMYRLRSGIHLQYNDERCVLYNLCCRLRRRNHLSVHRMYCNNEQGMFSLYCMCCWNTEKCDMYSNSQHCVYSLCSGIHLQYNDERCVLYYLCRRLRRRNYLSIHSMYSDDE